MFQVPLRRFLQKTSDSKVKLLFLFLISLGLPSLFLMFLAIRGIKNDQALEEQRLLSDHQEMADILAAEVDREISTAEQRLHNLFGVIANRSGKDRLEQLKEFASSPLIDECFVLKDDGLHFPLANLLYRTESKSLPQRGRRGGNELEQLIDEAEKSEFQLNNHNRALELYRTALNRTRDDKSSADLLMRIARVSVRAGSLLQALQTYEVVAEQYSQTRLPSGLPSGLAARLELAKLTHRTDDTPGAAVLIDNLYEDLLAGVWILNRLQFGLARNKIESLAANLKDALSSSQPNVVTGIDALKRKADSLVSRTDFLLEFGNLASPVILDLMQNNPGDGDFSKRLVTEDNDHQYLLLIAGGSARSDSDIICWGTLLHEGNFLGTVLPNSVNGLSLGDDQLLGITNRSGVRLYGSPPPDDSRLTVSRTFVGDFPPWSIELHQVDALFFEQLLWSRRSIYVYALVIVMLALTLGAIMTARIVARELELARLKSDFVSTVSHEFRSPLTSIRQLSEMLQRGRVQSEERRKQYYDIILEQSERLSLMISNILDLAGIDERRFRLNREYIRVEELLKAIITRAGQQGDEEKLPVKLCVKSPVPAAYIDPEAITHVMNNLIDNAIKYANRSPEVTVTAFSDRTNLTITVQDNGIGIPRDETERVFERFYRGGDELTRRLKGSGLGLSLVRELVRAHGGTVSVISEVDKGSTFTIRLPLTGNEGNDDG